MGTVDRARRALSLGPSAGGSLAIGLSGGELDGAISFGLGVYLYDVPVAPTPASLRALVEERVRARVEEKVRGMIERGEPAPGKEEVERLMREVAEEVRREVLSYASVQPRTLERPRMAFDLEGRLPGASEAWQVRASAGIGLKWVSLGPTVAVHLGDEAALMVGPSIDLRLLPGAGPRSPVLDLFVRADFAVAGGDEVDPVLAVGLRALLDLI